MARSYNLQASVERFVKLVVQDEGIESAWLSALANMEELAGKQIKGNISGLTPPDAVAEIEEHAEDEFRHSREFQAMRPVQQFSDGKYNVLEQKMRELTGSFVVSYFGNPLLVTAQNKHVAYVHGALTIEQFPFQLYTTYLEHTKIPKVLERLPAVLADEGGHLALGKKLRGRVPAEQKLSLAALQTIEKDMCYKMVERLYQTVVKFMNLPNEFSPDSIHRAVNFDEKTRVAWAWALSHAEAAAVTNFETIFTEKNLPPPDEMEKHKADELRHSKLLMRAVILERRKFARDPSYLELENQFVRALDFYLLTLFSQVMRTTSDPNLIYPYGALALETRVFKDYTKLMGEIDHMGVAHVLGTILVEEAEHTQMAGDLLKLQPHHQPDLFDKIKKKEYALHDRLQKKVIRAVQNYGSPVMAQA